MLLQLDEDVENSYGFQFQKQTELANISTIHAIGTELRERTTGSNYYWDCNLRSDVETFIFQYTLEGSGEIQIKGKTQSLPAGCGFFVSVPEVCEYYLPPTSDIWRFIYITLEGSQAKKCWETINNQHGHVFEIPLEMPLIQRLFATYKKVKDGHIGDAYQTANVAFEFLSYCYQHFEKDHTFDVPRVSVEIDMAIEFIKKHHHQGINIADIAEHVGLSKSYLNLRFKEEVGLPPLNYLNKYRIEKSAYLLQHTEKTVKEISFELGFSDPNYFCKAFRKAIGSSPNTFRKDKDAVHSFDFLVTDEHGMIGLE